MINFGLEVLRESDRIASVQGKIQGTGTVPVLEFWNNRVWGIIPQPGRVGSKQCLNTLR